MRAVLAAALGTLLLPPDTQVRVTTPLVNDETIEKHYGWRAVAEVVVVSAALVAVTAAMATAQVPVPSPATPFGHGPSDPPPVSVEGHYGPPEPEDLDLIANGVSAQKRNVKVKGRLADLIGGPVGGARYLSLTDGAARVVLVPFQAQDYEDLATLVGVEVEVTGIVRALPTHHQQKVRCYDGMYLESKCEDFLLPELPDWQQGWPSVSITVIRLSDRGKEPVHRAPRALADTGIEAAAADHKPVRAIGQFRGGNLCGDLPVSSRRLPVDWVLRTPEGPVWVVGHRPEGDGFHLDPAYRGDTARWLEVRGKVEIVEGVRYLKAGHVALASRPEEAAATACPP